MTNEQTSKKVVVTKKNNLEEEIKSGGMVRLAGVSETLSNASNIHMAIATIPQDRCSTTHFHTNCESAIYVLSGKGLFLHGARNMRGQIKYLRNTFRKTTSQVSSAKRRQRSLTEV